MRAKWPGVGPRIVERLRALGYTSERTKTGADLMRFSLEHSYPITYLQKWATDGATPDRVNLLRLVQDLDVSLQWLLVGNGDAPRAKGGKPKRRPHPISGASDARYYVNQFVHWLRCLCARPLDLPRWA